MAVIHTWMTTMSLNSWMHQGMQTVTQIFNCEKKRDRGKRLVSLSKFTCKSGLSLLQIHRVFCIHVPVTKIFLVLFEHQIKLKITHLQLTCKWIFNYFYGNMFPFLLAATRWRLHTTTVCMGDRSGQQGTVAGHKSNPKAGEMFWVTLWRKENGSLPLLQCLWNRKMVFRKKVLICGSNNCVIMPLWTCIGKERGSSGQKQPWNKGPRVRHKPCYNH